MSASRTCRSNNDGTAVAISLRQRPRRWRRILVENARRKASSKRGGDCQRIDLPDLPAPAGDEQIDLVALDEALREFEAREPQKAQVVMLKFFAGCSLEETARMLEISRATAQRHWVYTRAWLFGRLNES